MAKWRDRLCICSMHNKSVCIDCMQLCVPAWKIMSGTGIPGQIMLFAKKFCGEWIYFLCQSNNRHVMTL